MFNLHDDAPDLMEGLVSSHPSGLKSMEMVDLVAWGVLTYCEQY
jgi:hypothetical protein